MKLAEEDLDVSELEKADYIRLYAEVLKELGRVAEAEPLFAQARAILSKEDEQDELTLD